METMKTCSKCGYTRQPLDNEFSNALPNACPKCFAFYEGESSAESPPGEAPADSET